LLSPFAVIGNCCCLSHRLFSPSTTYWLLKIRERLREVPYQRIVR
jgi:hypothetical protein